jgi:hypothetical protein
MTETEMTEFERGARAAAEAIRLYLVDENEAPMYEMSVSELDSFETGSVADALADERRRIEREGTEDPVVAPSAYRVLPTGYASSEFIEKYEFEVSVNLQGADLGWAVSHGKRHLSADGTWEQGLPMSMFYKEFRSQFCFPLEVALQMATDAVDSVKINGFTFAQWAEQMAASES